MLDSSEVVIWGWVIDEEMENEVRVTMIAYML